MTYSESVRYANDKGTRIPTSEELESKIAANGGASLFPTDQWAAVTTDNGFNGKDWIQIGTNSVINPGGSFVHDCNCPIDSLPGESYPKWADTACGLNHSVICYVQPEQMCSIRAGFDK